jgi:hypothetical protein
MKFDPYLAVLCSTAFATSIAVPVWNEYLRRKTESCVGYADHEHAERLILTHRIISGLYAFFAIIMLIWWSCSDSEWHDNDQSNMVTAQVYGAFFLVLFGLISAVVAGCLIDREELAKAQRRVIAVDCSNENIPEAAQALVEAQGRHQALVIASLISFGPLILLFATATAASRKIDGVKDLMSMFSSPGSSFLQWIKTLIFGKA